MVRHFCSFPNWDRVHVLVRATPTGDILAVSSTMWWRGQVRCTTPSADAYARGYGVFASVGAGHAQSRNRLSSARNVSRRWHRVAVAPKAAVQFCPAAKRSTTLENSTRTGAISFRASSAAGSVTTQTCIKMKYSRMSKLVVPRPMGRFKHHFPSREKYSGARNLIELLETTDKDDIVFQKTKRTRGAMEQMFG